MSEAYVFHHYKKQHGRYTSRAYSNSILFGRIQIYFPQVRAHHSDRLEASVTDVTFTQIYDFDLWVQNL